MNNNYLPNNEIIKKDMEFKYKNPNKKYHKKNKRRNYNKNNNYNNKNFNLNFENDKFSFQINTPIPNLGNLLVGALGQALFKQN